MVRYLRSWSCHAVKAGALWGRALSVEREEGLVTSPASVPGGDPQQRQERQGRERVLKMQLQLLLWTSTLPTAFTALEEIASPSVDQEA